MTGNFTADLGALTSVAMTDLTIDEAAAYLAVSLTEVLVLIRADLLDVQGAHGSVVRSGEIRRRAASHLGVGGS